MTRADEPTPSADHLESALEASCDALITLEAIPSTSGSEAGDRPRTRLHVAQAIELLRRAIAELQLAHNVDGPGLALGFVLRAERERSVGRANPDAQASPRRTA
jgi:hypothetical protein